MPPPELHGCTWLGHNLDIRMWHGHCARETDQLTASDHHEVAP